MGISWSLHAKQYHVVLFGYEAWGHTRPLCNLAARLAQSRPIYVTLFTITTIHDRVRDELFRSFDADEGHLLDRVRVISLTHNSANAQDRSILEDSFATAFEKLAKEEAVQCVHTGVSYDPVRAPDALVVDFDGRTAMEHARRVGKKDFKVFAWHAGSASLVFRFWGPKQVGWIGDLRERSEYEAECSGIKVEEAAGEILLGHTGCVVYIPGLPPMYDHEVQPQRALGSKGQLGGVMLGAHDVYNECDGMLLATPECYEPETVAALKNWFAESSRKVFPCGPLVPYGEQATSQQKERSVHIQEFMNGILKKRGERTLVFISFGSMYWPQEDDQLSAFLDVMIELGIPFILNHASAYLSISDSIAQKVEGYEDAILTRWSPQQLILRHPAMAWFITHGGQSSVIESISEGIPMICWPFAFDQPLNAAHITVNLDIGYELFQIRNGPGLGLVHRLGKAPEGSVEAVRTEAQDVLTRAFGEDGARKRANVLKLKHRMVGQPRSKHHPSRRAIDAFLDSLDST
ncbi:glycosyltransferase family 1 protein [Laetiporus sulphureus 93-53]|uniref:Glycosyltransferase family 1 protein n=1 Tax=Laetiporus sulphureus 93-53 TaxID=1314785 RepID=A0A165EJS0_9APHY|nr:glycosyltransferase family 1 protein [Laetiporus sulphureus 93-53]KZT07197.1 glycosyltransferase family 1 protein [Laetiporus sulphureus 93-53]